MRYVTICVLVFSTFAQTTIQQTDTGGLSNGRAWELFSDFNKIGYVSALRDSILYNAAIGQRPAEEVIKEKWATGFTIGDYIKELNTLYKERENIRIPIVMAFDFCSKKLKGETSQQDLETSLIALRKLTTRLE